MRKGIGIFKYGRKINLCKGNPGKETNVRAKQHSFWMNQYGVIPQSIQMNNVMHIVRFSIAIFCLILLGSCQPDTAETTADESSSDVPPKVERTGPESVFQILNADGDLIHNVKIFETASLSHGTVYQFSRGEGQINFEEGPKYMLRAPGYRDVSFKLEGVDRMTRVLFYMWKEDAPNEGLSISGDIKADNFRAFKDVTVQCNGESIATDESGAFFLTPQFDEMPAELPVLIQWPVTKMEMSEVKVILLEKPDFPVRMSLFLQTNVVLPPKQKSIQ